MAKKKSPAKSTRKLTKPLAKPALKKAKAAPAKKKGKAAPAKKKAMERKAPKAVKKTAKTVVKKVAKPTRKVAEAKPIARKSVVKKAVPPKPTAKAAVRKAAVPSPAKKAAPTKAARTATTPPARERPTTPAKPTTRQQITPAPVVKPASAATPIVTKKRPAKERVVMEFYLNSSPIALYDLLSTPSGFSEWYCQDVDVRGDQYRFIWDGEEEATTLIGRKQGEVIRFRRNDDDDPEAFFEFRIRIDAMTNEVCLVVTDHAWPQEVEETRNLWTSQIETLGRVLGA